MKDRSDTTLIVLPNQLFLEHPGLSEAPERIVLVEDALFFGDVHHPVAFHKQKLWLHRASMKRYEQMLIGQGLDVDYFEHEPGGDPLVAALTAAARGGGGRILLCEPADHLLERRLERHGRALGLEIRTLPGPMFLNTDEENRAYRSGRKRWFMADYYKFQRRRFDVLMDGDEPEGGRWSFDESNRRKVPKSLLGTIPAIESPDSDELDASAREHVLGRYPENPGRLDRLIYPTSHSDARDWLDAFLRERFELFGDFEDAIVRGENTLWHSVLTPMLNVGLLTPRQVLDAALERARNGEVPLNSVEGFVRQVIGWREFMRATYVDLGVPMRTTNHWGHHRSIPASFWDGSTGIAPLDDVIGRVLETGYCHHIERLMVVGGFMFLCEFDPDEIYRWFMALFVDAYDWVMVPNVYAMSQNADGGTITTKPYFSGSSYLRKMGNHPRGEWETVWDGLYWRWIWNHCDELARNPRWAMMCAMVRKMEPARRDAHLEAAERFLESLTPGTDPTLPAGS